MPVADKFTAIFRGFEPCAWTVLMAIPRERRLQKFSVPGVDEMSVIENARTRVAAQLSQEEPRHRAETSFLREVGFARKDLLPAFKTAWQFYQWLVYSAFRYSTGLDPAILDAFPARELICAAKMEEPVDWLARWGEVGGVLRKGRMVAETTDPVWARLSVLGLPYPPFEFGSSPDVRDIRAKEWRRLTHP